MGLFKKLGRGLKKAGRKIVKHAPSIGGLALTMIPGGGIVKSGMQAAIKTAGAITKANRKNKPSPVGGMSPSSMMQSQKQLGGLLAIEEDKPAPPKSASDDTGNMVKRIAIGLGLAKLTGIF